MHKACVQGLPDKPSSRLKALNTAETLNLVAYAWGLANLHKDGGVSLVLAEKTVGIEAEHQ